MKLFRMNESLLVRRDVRRLLVVAAVSFGSATWALEAILSQVVHGAPEEPLGGVYRLVESMLWIFVAAIAVRVAELWPIDNPIRAWRRTLAQFSLAIALGPLWGMFAYAISPYLMPWWYERGMWGIVAKEAKGALFGYTVTAGLVHVILRARRQRAREVAASAMDRAAADAQLVMRKLELQPAIVLRSMDAIARMIPSDVDGANEALVALADGMRRSLALTRVRTIALREELDAAEDALRLRSITVGPRVRLVASADDKAVSSHLPALFLAPLVDRLSGWSSDASEISLQARVRSDRLLIALSLATHGRPSPGLDDSAEWLIAARERLRAVCGESSSVHTWASGERTHVEIELPRSVVGTAMRSA